MKMLIDAEIKALLEKPVESIKPVERIKKKVKIEVEKPKFEVETIS